MPTNETKSGAKASEADPMDVVEISVGTTPESWDLAQMHPPGAQQPALDPFADQVKKDDPESLDAGAKWPRQPGGPADEDGTLSSAMGTHGQQESEPETGVKTVTEQQPDSAHQGEAPSTSRSGNRTPSTK
jgi:hypothetical protein